MKFVTLCIPSTLVLLLAIPFPSCALMSQQNQLSTGEKRERQKDLIKM